MLQTHSDVCDPFDLYPLATKTGLETLAIFAVAVAGRTPKVVWPKVTEFLRPSAQKSPFDYLRQLGRDIDSRLRQVRMGQYTRIGAALTQMAALRLGWTWRNLLDCPGVSYKTAKLVQVYTHPGPRAACLDRHVLRLIKTHPLTQRTVGVVPEVSPACPIRYAALEGVALYLADHYSLAGWQFDRIVWRAAAAGMDPIIALEAFSST